MKKTMLVMVNEIATTLRRKQFVILAIGIPLILGVVALIVAALNQNPSQAPEGASGVADSKAPGEMAEGYVDVAKLIQTMPEDAPSGWLVEYPDEEAALAALEAEQIEGFYIIDPDYVESGAITHVVSEYNPISDRAGDDGIRGILNLNLLGDAEVAAAVWQPLDINVTTLKPVEAGVEDNWVVELFPTLMTLILYMVILMPASMLINAITDEKKNQIMEVLMSSLSAQQMLTGKILALGLLGLLQTALWVGVLWAVTRFGGQSLRIPEGFEVPTSMVVWSFIYGFLGYAMYGAQLAGLGALVPDVKDARTASFVLLAPLIGVYMFMILIFEAPNGIFAMIMSFFPLTAPVGMIARMTQTPVPIWQATLAAVLQLLTAILIVRLAGRAFHAQHLLSGQPFSIKRYFRVLLGQPA